MELSNGERQGWPERIATSHQSHQSLSSTQTDITAQKLMMQSPISPNGKDGDVTSGPSGLSGGATLDPRKNNPEFTSNVLAIDTTHNHPTTMKSPAPATTALQTKLKQHTTSIIIATMTIILLGFSIWFIDIEFISEKPLPEHLQLSTRRTILLVNIISHVNVFLASLLLEISYETLRWSLASRNGGVSLSTFLALSKATSFMGITDLIRVRGWHQVLCIQRLLSKALCFFLGVVLFLNVNYAMIYTPDGSPPLNIIAGVTPIYGFIDLPSSVLDIYIEIYSKDILMDITLVKSIPPLTCSGPDCTSFFLPGGLDLLRLANGGPNATLFSAPPRNGTSAFITNNAPGYHVEYLPVPKGFGFNKTSDCTTYGGSSNEAINICVSAEGTQIYAGWSICPTDLFTTGQCLTNTTWTDQPNESTVLNIQKRYATVAFDVNNFSILSIESISDPVVTTTTFITEAVRNLTHIISLAFSSIPSTLNTSDPNFPTYASSWGSYWILGWALRLYEDDYKNYPGGPLDVLKSFLTIPIQFSTTAWQLASWDTLPSDLNTTGTYATSSPRVLGKQWMLIAFATGAGSLVLSSVLGLLWAIIFGPMTPNPSRWPEADMLARSRIQRAENSDEEELGDIIIPGLESFAGPNGLGNETSSTVRACIRGERVFVGNMGGAIVVAMKGEGVGVLKAGTEYR